MLIIFFLKIKILREGDNNVRVIVVKILIIMSEYDKGKWFLNFSWNI